MKKKEFLLFLSIVSFTVSYAQKPQQYIDSFFMNMKKKETNIALDSLFKTNSRFAKESSADIENIKSQLQKISGVIGVYNNSELIFYNKLGQSVEIYSYLVKYQKQPLRFTFIFYKALDKWEIYNFQFDSNLIDELYEKSKIYLLEDQKK